MSEHLAGTLRGQAVFWAEGPSGTTEARPEAWSAGQEAGRGPAASCVDCEWGSGAQASAPRGAAGCCSSVGSTTAPALRTCCVGRDLGKVMERPRDVGAAA